MEAFVYNMYPRVFLLLWGDFEFCYPRNSECFWSIDLCFCMYSGLYSYLAFELISFAIRFVSLIVVLFVQLLTTLNCFLWILVIVQLPQYSIRSVIKLARATITKVIISNTLNMELNWIEIRRYGSSGSTITHNRHSQFRCIGTSFCIRKIC